MSFCCRVTSARGLSGISRMNGPRYPITGEATTDLSMASTATARSTPPFSARATASQKTTISTIRARLMATFICTAVPDGPMWLTLEPMSYSTGFTFSKAPASPPTMVEAVPAATVTGLPERGASSMVRPRSANAAAVARLTCGSMVLMSR